VIRVNREVNRISENNEREREREKERKERRMCWEKLAIPKDVCSGKMDIETSPMRAVEISIDSQLGGIPSVVSAPMPLAP